MALASIPANSCTLPVYTRPIPSQLIVFLSISTHILGKQDRSQDTCMSSIWCGTLWLGTIVLLVIQLTATFEVPNTRMTHTVDGKQGIVYSVHALENSMS